MINIDLTTRNTVYNTIGPQAQWIQHRFGRRNYPNIDINLENIIKFIKSTNDTIHLSSFFGDPCSYHSIVELLDHIDQGRLVINTNLNFLNEQLIDQINQKQAYVVVPIFGINELNDTVILNSKWDIIHNNLKHLKVNGCLEFYTYQHNKHQISEITQIAKDVNFDLKILPGISTHPDGFSPIVNDKGEWLYDVYTSNSKWNTLEKTVNGYNSLIQYVKPITGKSILNNPTVHYIDEAFHYSNNNISISVTGDVFPSADLSRIFSNALCTDWSLAVSNIKNLNKTAIREDLKYYCLAVKFILNYLKLGNNLNRKSAEEILAYLANSNI